MLLSHSPQANRMSGMVYRQLMLYRRHLDRYFEMMLWPTLDALMFGAIGTYAAKQGGSFRGPAILLAGFIMAQMTWQAHIFVAKYFMQESWDHNVLYLMTRPIRTKEIMLAALMMGAAVVGAAAIFIGTVVGLTFHLSVLRVPPEMILLLPILMLMGWSTGMLVIGLILRLGQKAENFAWVIFGLIGPLSGAIVPVDNLPGVLRQFAMVLPTTHAYEAGRAILFDVPFPGGQLAIAGAGALSMYGLALWYLARSFAVFRRKGFISRYM